MYEFLDRLVNVALPQSRDFAAVARALMGVVIMPWASADYFSGG